MAPRNVWMTSIGIGAGFFLSGSGPCVAASYSSITSLRAPAGLHFVDCDNCLNAPVFTPENSRPQSSDDNGSSDNAGPGETANAPLFTPDNARPQTSDENGPADAPSDSAGTGGSLFAPENGKPQSSDDSNPFSSEQAPAIQPPRQ